MVPEAYFKRKNREKEKEKNRERRGRRGEKRKSMRVQDFLNRAQPTKSRDKQV